MKKVFLAVNFDSKIALSQKKFQQTICLRLVTKVLQEFDRLQVVAFLMLQEYVHTLKHLDQIVSLLNQTDKRDGFKQL